MSGRGVPEPQDADKLWPDQWLSPHTPPLDAYRPSARRGRLLGLAHGALEEASWSNSDGSLCKWHFIDIFIKEDEIWYSLTLINFSDPSKTCGSCERCSSSCSSWSSYYHPSDWLLSGGWQRTTLKTEYTTCFHFPWVFVFQLFRPAAVKHLMGKMSATFPHYPDCLGLGAISS